MWRPRGYFPASVVSKSFTLIATFPFFPLRDASDTAAWKPSG
jgi:hypothetical protein